MSLQQVEDDMMRFVSVKRSPSQSSAEETSHAENLRHSEGTFPPSFLAFFLSGSETRGADYRAVPHINAQGFIGGEVTGSGTGGSGLGRALKISMPGTPGTVSSSFSNFSGVTRSEA